MPDARLTKRTPVPRWIRMAAPLFSWWARRTGQFWYCDFDMRIHWWGSSRWHGFQRRMQLQPKKDRK